MNSMPTISTGNRPTRAAALLWLFATAISAAAPSAVPPQSVLARRVDDPQPYFSRVRIAPTGPAVGQQRPVLSALTDALSRHFGGGIRMLVKNDLQVLLTDTDAAELTPQDRLEVWLLGSGVATRLETYASFARYGQEGERWRTEAAVQREKERLERLAQQLLLASGATPVEIPDPKYAT